MHFGRRISAAAFKAYDFFQQNAHRTSWASNRIIPQQIVSYILPIGASVSVGGYALVENSQMMIQRRLERPYAKPTRSPQWLTRDRAYLEDLHLKDPRPKILLASFGTGKTAMLEDVLHGEPAHFVSLRDGCASGHDFQQVVFRGMGFSSSRMAKIMEKLILNTGGNDCETTHSTRHQVTCALRRCKVPPIIVIDDIWRLVGDKASGFVDEAALDTFYWLQTLAFKKGLIKLICVTDNNSFPLALRRHPRANQNLEHIHMFYDHEHVIGDWIRKEVEGCISSDDAFKIAVGLGGHFEQIKEVIRYYNGGMTVKNAVGEILRRHWKELDEKFSQLSGESADLRAQVNEVLEAIKQDGFARPEACYPRAVEKLMQLDIVISTPSDPKRKAPCRQLTTWETQKFTDTCRFRFLGFFEFGGPVERTLTVKKQSATEIDHSIPLLRPRVPALLAALRNKGAVNFEDLVDASKRWWMEDDLSKLGNTIQSYFGSWQYPAWHWGRKQYVIHYEQRDGSVMFEENGKRGRLQAVSSGPPDCLPQAEYLAQLRHVQDNKAAGEIYLKLIGGQMHSCFRESSQTAWNPVQADRVCQ